MHSPVDIPKIIIVLAAEAYVRPGTFANFDAGMYLGGQLRFDAAAQLASSGAVQEMILLGGYNREPGSDPLASDRVDDMADYIAPHCHPSTKLTLVRSLYCTHHNFVALGRSWQRTGTWPARVGVLSNAFHLTRALEFAARALPEVIDADIELVPIVAEEVLGISVDDIIRGHEAEYETRLKNEAQGLRQLRDGTYQDVCFSKLRDYAQLLIESRGRELLTNAEMSEHSQSKILT